jgi:cephalosporin hydroxylase
MSTIEEDYARRCGQRSDISLHMPYLHERARGATVIELGVRTGNSTCAFLAAGADLWSCDINLPDVPDSWGLDLPNWHFVHGPSISVPVVTRLPWRCDLLFVDASHEFADTLAELRVYVPRVRPGGVVLMHDTQLARDGRDLGSPEGPVALALTRFCFEAGLLWSNRPGSFGLGVIEIPPRPEPLP